MRNAPTLHTKTREIMQTLVSAVSRGTIGRDIAAQFVSGGLSGYPVIERMQELLGVVTELDLLRALAQGKDLRTIKAEDIMSKSPIVVEEDVSIKVVVQMLKKNILRMPVVKDNKLIGVISRSNILRHMITPKTLICAYGPF